MARAIAVSAMTLACALALAANAGTSAGAVTCGGIGSDARAEMESAASDANLELEFFAGRRGAYIADVDVTLTPMDGGDAFSTTADGPICFAHLAPGRYRVEWGGQFQNMKRAQQRLRLDVHACACFVFFRNAKDHGDADDRGDPCHRKPDPSAMPHAAQMPECSLKQLFHGQSRCAS